MIQADKYFKIFDEIIKPLPKSMQALGSTLFISVVPIFVIYVFNRLFISTKDNKNKVTLYLISFAIGGLLGDVFFHTLPHIGGEDH